MKLLIGSSIVLAGLVPFSIMAYPTPILSSLVGHQSISFPLAKRSEIVPDLDFSPSSSNRSNRRSNRTQRRHDRMNRDQPPPQLEFLPRIESHDLSSSESNTLESMGRQHLTRADEYVNQDDVIGRWYALPDTELEIGVAKTHLARAKQQAYLANSSGSQVERFGYHHVSEMSGHLLNMSGTAAKAAVIDVLADTVRPKYERLARSIAATGHATAGTALLAAHHTSKGAKCVGKGCIDITRAMKGMVMRDKSGEGSVSGGKRRLKSSDKSIDEDEPL